MMMNLAGTKTEQNLRTAFAGESQARNKYTYYAAAAQKEGYEQIADIFRATAENETAHAKIWFKLLGGISDTKSNLTDAAAGENALPDSGIYESQTGTGVISCRQNRMAGQRHL